MKRLSPPIVAGVLFVVLFLVVVYAFQLFGVWNPPGVSAEGEDDHEHEEYSGETYDSANSEIELHGDNNVLEFVEENGIELECAAHKLGKTPEELDIDARSLHNELDIEIDEILNLLLECPRTEPEKLPELDVNDENPVLTGEEQVKYSDDGITDIGFDSSKILGSDNILIIANQYGIPEDCLAQKLGISVDQLDIRGRDLKDQLGVDMDYIREKMDECLGLTHISSHEEESTNSAEPVEEEVVVDEPLPALEGSDNLLEYLTSVDAPPDCIAQFLGIGVDALDATAKDLKDSLGIDMDAIRDVIDNCIEISKNLDVNTKPPVEER